MNHYLGQDVPEGANENCDLHEGFEDDGWWFEPTNYVLKEPIYKVGQWYKSTPEANKRDGEIYYAKYLSDDFKASDYKVSGNIKSIEYKFSSGYIWELLTDLSEIQDLLPAGHVDKIVSEDYTGRWIKALINNPSATGIKLGEVIQIISKPGCYILDRTSQGYSGMGISYPLNTSEWELVETDTIDIPKDSEKIEVEKGVKLKFFPTSGAILISECDNLKEFKRYLFDSGRTCNEAVGNPKYLSWNGTSFWYPTTGTGKTMYKWNQLKHFVPTSKIVPGYVKCVQALMNAKVGKIYLVVDEKHCLCEDGDTYEWDSQEFINSTKQEYDAQISKDVSMIDIQKECKKRFPIGCTYKQIGSATKITLRKDEYTYTIHGDRIYAHAGGGLLYNNGIYAITIPEEDCDNQDPLYICKQEYRKGMRVKSASKTGVYSKEFIIDVDPKEFRNLSGNKDIVDYSCSKGYLYYKGEYAEILEESDMLSLEIPPISELVSVTKLDMINYNSGIDDYLGNSRFKERNPEAYNWLTKPSIETVHSVDVNLRTKKQINKFKF
jgi:hypothetical protein